MKAAQIPIIAAIAHELDRQQPGIVVDDYQMNTIIAAANIIVAAMGYQHPKVIHAVRELAKELYLQEDQ